MQLSLAELLIMRDALNDHIANRSNLYYAVTSQTPEARANAGAYIRQAVEADKLRCKVQEKIENARRAELKAA